MATKNRQARVVNRHHEPFDIYIGRGTIWGNKFKSPRDGTRAEVIEKYREWLSGQWELLDRLDELQGKVLGCSCKPLRCHGDILAELVNNRSLITVGKIEEPVESGGNDPQSSRAQGGQGRDNTR